LAGIEVSPELLMLALESLIAAEVIDGPMRPAISLGDSILQTASIARWMSVTGTATDHIIFRPVSATQHDLKARCR
jgi:hypothetical protein